MADILIVAENDWANLGYVFQECLRSVGVNALAVKAKPHGFGYPKQAQIIRPWKDVQPLAEEARGILWMHTKRLKLHADLSDKFKAVFHGGTACRRNPQKATEIFNPIVDATIIQTVDLLGYGAVNEHWVMPAVDTDHIKPHGRQKGPIRVGHFPANPEKKGTEAILRVIDRLKHDQSITKEWEWVHSPFHVAWAANLERMAECDIYVERMNHRVAEWGITALEASALGCAVITQFASRKRYEKEYGKSPLIAITDEDDLFLALRDLIMGHGNKLRSLQRRHRKWAEKLHSYKAIGERLKRVFSPILECDNCRL